MGLSATAKASIGRSDPVLRVVVTPRPEARTLCRLVLTALLSARIPSCETDITTAIDTHDQYRCAHEVKAALSGLTVVDPACGDGQVLLGMAHVLEELDGQGGAAGYVFHGIDVQKDVLAKAQRAFNEIPVNPPPAVGFFCDDALRWENWPHRMPPGGYDCVVGNPPYVRHEAIRDPHGCRAPSAYKAVLREGVEARFPGLNIGGRADLALCFTLLGLSLLGPYGVLGFVLPTALFQARYGAVLEEALRCVDRTAVFVESETSRSFSDASVNTGLLLAIPASGQARDGSGIRVRHVRVRGTLADGEGPRQLVGSPGAMVRTADDETVGMRSVPLRALGRIRYPVKTGLNRFFYPSPEQIERFGIEEEFLLPVVKSPRDVPAISLDAEQGQNVAFVCSWDEDELEAAGQYGALAYVRWGAAQYTADGTPWPRVPSLRSRKRWYSLGVPVPADVLCPRFFHRRFLFVTPIGPMLEDQTFYGLVMHDPSERDLLAALLNSSLTHLSLEQHGRTGLGDGVRQYALCDMAEVPVPDMRIMDRAAVPAILDAYRSVSTRPLLAVPEEYEQGDRLVLDDAVGKAFGVGCMEGVRDTVMELAERRIARAKSL